LRLARGWNGHTRLYIRSVVELTGLARELGVDERTLRRTPDSDLDLLVSLREDRADAAVKLAVRLERAVGRDVDVARLNRVRDSAPLLLLQSLDEGRVVLDRDGEWAALQTSRGEIARRARDAHEARRSRARASVRELLAAER
jgi:hypothetical protein